MVTPVKRPPGGTVTASQKGAAPLAVFAAPATGDEFNTLGERLVPKGCFKIEDLLFDFDSSFVRPDIAQDLPRLVQLRGDNTVKDPKSGGDLFPPLSIFGHADPVGNDDHNKQLSGRRAMAIYGMLVRDVDLWERLFTTPVGTDDWGTRAVQTMLSRVQAPVTVNGTLNGETRDAVRAFQTAQGLKVDGGPGSSTRKALYRAYMDALCGPNLLLDKETDFLGRNGDPGGKGDFQGCGEFNPLLLFSKAESAAFEKAADKTERNRENAPNRRVMILLFAAGRRVKPAAWPCPRASEGVAACKKRFFPDAEVRRSFQSQRRAFEDTKDTFACRFYQIISDDSPCERVKPAPPPPPPPPIPEANPLIIFGRPPAATRQSALVGDAQISGRNFVIVKKPYTKPARVEVTLKSDRPFTGSGEFTIQDSSNLRFFPEKDNLLAIRFNGVDNVFTGELLSAGVTVFAEGLRPSKAVDDITLILTLSPQFATIATVTRAQVTAVELTLDICAARASATAAAVPLPQPTTALAPPRGSNDKLFGGRFLRIQTPKKTRERATLIVRLQPTAFSTTLELTSDGNKVSIFNNENASTAGAVVTLPLPIPSSTVPAAGKRLFVQGDQLSRKSRDVELQLGVQGVEPDGDRVSVTVTASVEIVTDSNNDHAINEDEPVAEFVRVGLWDRAFDAATGNLQNTATETTNFAGGDTRRFYFRVHDPGSTGEVRVRFKTIFDAGGNDDVPASQEVTCTETAAGSKFFASRGVILVADTVDQAQATDSGLPAGNVDAGGRNAGQSNHRTRKITVDDTNKLTSKVSVQYVPASGNPSVTVSVPLFNRSPEERRKIKVHLINVRRTVGGAGILTAARKAAGIAQMRSVYAACGIFLDIEEINLDPPASCIGWTTKYPTAAAAGIAADPAVESASSAAGNLVPSASQLAIINAVRARPDFDPNDLYVVYISRIYANPVPPPPGARPGPQLAIGPGGIAFTDGFTAAGSLARSFVFVGVTTVNNLADVHEMTHVTTDLRNSAGGHFHLQATVAAGPGLIDGKNLMQRFALISATAISDSKRLWDEPFTNAGINPPTIPAQIAAIRGSRFIKPF